MYQSEALLTYEQAAQHLQVSPRTVRKYVADGVLNAYKIGPKNVRISRAELEAIQRPTNSQGVVDRITALIAQAPPLSNGQRAHLAELIGGGAS